MGGGGGDSGSLDLERKQLAAQQELLNERNKKLEVKRIAALRAKFTSGGLSAPGQSATAPATIGVKAPSTIGSAPPRVNPFGPFIKNRNRTLGG